MSALLRRLRGESGLALPLALGVMVVTGMMVVSIVEYTSSSGRTANLGKAGMSAEALAEAGLANAFAVLNNDANNPADPTLLSCDAAGTTCTPIVSTYESGTATWSGALNALTSTWLITSVGEVFNPTGGAPVQKTLTAQVPLVSVVGPPNAAVWNYLYSTREPGAGCDVNVSGTNVIIDIPLYVRGDLCLTGTNVEIDERGEGQTPAPQPIDLRVGGKLVFTGEHATVGKSTDYITSAAVAGGCATSIGGAGQTCAQPPFNWYVTTTSAFEEIEAPTVDYASWFAANDTINSTSTVAGQDGDCDVRSGSPPAINPDTMLDGDAGTINLTGSAYTCRKTADGTAGGTVVAELSWDGSSVLTIKGAIMVDGNVTMNDSNATYQGMATIYANGAFTLSGSNATMCANTTCDFTTWNPNTEMLIMVATSVNLTGSNSKWQGGLFCNPTATAVLNGTNVEIQGPVICGTFTFGTNTAFKPLPGITNLPIGAPVEPNVSIGPGTPIYGG
jgi:hypothetical protein